MRINETTLGWIFTFTALALCYINKESGSVWIFSFGIGFYAHEVLNLLVAQKRKRERESDEDN